MLNRIIPYSFYLLFFLTPLFWTSLNYELFEFNKMILVYGFTIVITGAWLLKIINRKSLIFNRTPLDIPLLLFLGANILSTIFSIDTHTSIWGYYSRLNGGLLSTVSYLLLYWAFVSNMDFDKVKTTLKFGLASGFIISLWAILEHFGGSVSCLILRGEFNNSCWIQDVQARVFATLGQPNWLASYLAMLIFPAFYFLLTATKKSSLTIYYILLTTYYLAFTFTYSRGPTLGLIGGLVVFLISYVISEHRFHRVSSTKSGLVSDSRIPALPAGRRERFFASLRMTKLAVILISFLIINLLFGSALTDFRLISKFAAPVRPGISLPPSESNPPSAGGTQLENGGTESGQIRLIVWKGALDIFKNYPIFGSGLETFAYSYYAYRPTLHNLTTEWDFLYNKAHNEYLNYLSTTGVVGFGTYILVIGSFLYSKVKTVTQNLKVNQTKLLTLTSNFELYTLHFALLASYISYLISNFFLFSVVIIAVFFYLFPALAFVATGSTSILHLPSSKVHFLFSIIYRRKIYTKIAQGIVIFSILYLLYSIFLLWYADTLFAKGEKASDMGNPGRAYNELKTASELNPGEPFYRSELSFAAAQAAVSLEEVDATLSAALKNEAVVETESILDEHPKNVSFFRTAVRTYFELSLIDKDYIDKTLQTLDESLKLAPTDPKLYYNKALILFSTGKKEEAIKALQQAIKLKQDYLEALDQLKEATNSAETK
ncbi:O-antigen ligase family protein [Candidatus Daviesbacteria bacterium]|nr:O-antigen ligase family protein [Candidatus Daviesbacteria bacterium]